MAYSVYILFSLKINKFYIGTTDNVEKRLWEHNNAVYKGSFSEDGIPWSIFISIDNLQSKQAYAIERHIKAMKSKKYIQNLTLYPEIIDQLKEKYKY